MTGITLQSLYRKIAKVEGFAKKELIQQKIHLSCAKPVIFYL